MLNEFPLTDIQSILIHLFYEQTQDTEIRTRHDDETSGWRTYTVYADSLA